MGLFNEAGLNEFSVPELVKLGHEARKLKEYDRALELFELALQKNPNNSNLSVEFARSLVDKGDIDSGYRILTSLEHLNQFPIYALLGRIERMKGDRKSALHYYSLAFDLKPDHPTLPAEIATELRALERLDESEQMLLSLFERLPNSPHALNGLAQIARIRGDRERALSYYKKLEATDPKHSNVHIDIAIELRELGRLEDAAQSLDISSNPNPGLIWHQKGLIANAQENHDFAVECFKSGIEQQRDHSACHQALIAKFFQLGSLDEVRTTLDIALGIFPNHIPFLRFEYRYKRAKGKLDIAIDLVQALNKIELNNLDIAHDFLDYLIFLGQFERASMLIESYQNHPQKDKILFFKSRLAMAQFMVDDAISFINEAISINAKNIQYRQHRLSLNIMGANISEAQDDVNYLKINFQNKGWGNKRLKSVGGFPAQVLLEIKLNPYANKRLIDSKQICLDDRFQSVAKIAKDEPNHLGAAIFLLMLLSQNKKSEQNLKALGGSAKKNIPSNIIQFWDSKDIPPCVQETMRSWRDLNPSFQYQIFDDQSAQDFIKAYHSSEVLKAFRTANHPAMRSDLFRLAYLYECGGVYADADDLCINSIAEFIGEGLDLILIQEPTGIIGNNFLAVKPKHTFIQYALNSIVKNILNKAGGIWFASGPGTLTISFCQVYCQFLERGLVPPEVVIKESYNLHQFVIPHLPMSYKTSKSGWRSPAGLASSIYR